MPIISQFYGIKITIFYDDHGEPHFHAYYGEHSAKFSIASGEIIVGSLPKRASHLVSAWMKLHTKELEADWELAKQHKVLQFIEPLE